MSIHISDLCNLQIFKSGISLIAGSDGLDRELQYITVMEVPDFAEHNLGNGLLVLTTFYSYRDNPALIEETVTKLAKKNISGIILKINRFINEVPENIIKIAEVYKLPLFVIREKDLAFREIISAVTSEIINYQFNIIKGINEQHELLYRAVLRGEKLDSFIKNIGKHLECTCACLSSFGEILAQYSETKPEPLDDLIALIQENKKINKKNLMRNSFAYIEIKNYFVFPCLAHNTIMGYFILQKYTKISELELLFAQQMVSFLSIKLLEKHLILETEQRMTTAIIDELLFHHSDESIVRDRLQLLGFIPSTNYCILVLSSRSKVKQESLYILHSRLQSISHYLKTVFPKSMVHLIADGLIVLVSFPSTSRHMKDENMRSILVGLSEVSELKNLMYIGCSIIESDLTQIPHCYETAKQAIRFGKAFSSDQSVHLYTDYLEIRMASHMLNTDEHKFLKRNVILPLNDYDKKYKAELWLTLEKCLTTGTLEKAAAELHIHSSTLRYRLQKITDLTNIDYFTARGKFMLNTAYILAKLESY